ncbi:MAG: phosphonoacetate hydrolase [Alphaproteobacteria bacterium]
MATTHDPVRLNGTTYRWPRKPVVVVCIDGGDPAYFARGRADGVIPTVTKFMTRGFSAVADGTVPSFTCPNNMSIVTGAPAAVHGISGNFYLERETGKAIVMTGPELLRSSTVMAEFARAGAKVVSITAKDKLRRQLGKGLDVRHGNVNFSSEKADQCTLAEHGIEKVLELVGMPLPHMYSAELSLFVLEAGIRILERQRPDILYLSLTDYIQHKYAPGEAEANRFYRAVDERFGRLAELGAVVALTADHGMNDKSKPDGSPNVIFLQDVLDAEFGKVDTKVICPITDYFVGHHGALGGFVRVYCLGGKATPADVVRVSRQLPGIAEIYERAEVARKFELPPDREGDVAVISDAGTCIGAAAADHDLSALAGFRLRSHGGVSESRVPFVLSEPLNDEYRRKAAAGGLNSRQIFEFAINGTA